MKISELSEQSGVPVATIKYYLREGLLMPGERQGPNRSRYDERHLRRLTLIRALRDIGNLPVDIIRRLIATIDDESRPLFEVMATVSRALLGPVGSSPSPEHATAERRVAQVFQDLGWHVDAVPELAQPLAEAFVAFRELCDPEISIEAFAAYATAVDRLARAEIEFTMARATEAGSRDVAIETMVAGTVIGERALAAFRRAAHVHYAALASRDQDLSRLSPPAPR